MLKGLLLILIKTAIIIAILNPITAFGGLKSYWQKQALYQKIDLCTQAYYSQIIPGLYLSNARAATDLNVLRKLNITHILTIEGHKLPKYVYDDANVTTLFIKATDSANTNLMPYFPMSNSFINKGIEKGNVLVHCHFGVSRSATLVIAYLMEKYKLSYEKAYEHVRQRRKFINPNSGFINQLKEYEKLNYDLSGLNKFAYHKKHKYKIISIAAVILGIIVVPIAVMIVYLPLPLY